MKGKLFKFLFKKQYEELNAYRNIPLTDAKIFPLQLEIKKLNGIIEDLKKRQPLIDPIDFANVDEFAKPPHFLANLTPEHRKNAIIRLETIYQDDWFIAAKNYVINVLGNYSFQVEPDENKMRNGRYAAIGVKTLMKEFEDAHSEFLASKKVEDEFDPLDILPV